MPALRLPKLDIPSALVEEPTDTAVEMQAGAFTPFVNPLLPDAMTVAMPMLSKLSIAAWRDAWAASQLVALAAPPPRLMLTEAIRLTLFAPARISVRSSAKSWSGRSSATQVGSAPQTKGLPSIRVKTCIAIKLAPGATPLMAPGPFAPAAMPPTWVPCSQPSMVALQLTPLPTAVELKTPPGRDTRGSSPSRLPSAGT